MTNPSPCALQEVSTPRLLRLFPCPDLSLLYALKLVSVPRSLSLISCSNLSHLCALKGVSPRLLGLFPCQYLSLSLHSLVCQCSSLAQFIFFVLTCLFHCAFQEVSAPCSLRLFPCLHLSLSALSSMCVFLVARFVHVLTSPCCHTLQKVSVTLAQFAFMF